MMWLKVDLEDFESDTDRVIEQKHIIDAISMVRGVWHVMDRTDYTITNTSVLGGLNAEIKALKKKNAELNAELKKPEISAESPPSDRRTAIDDHELYELRRRLETEIPGIQYQLDECQLIFDLMNNYSIYHRALLLISGRMYCGDEMSALASEALQGNIASIQKLEERLQEGE